MSNEASVKQFEEDRREAVSIAARLLSFPQVVAGLPKGHGARVEGGQCLTGS
jgi:hypothetical protein